MPISHPVTPYDAHTLAFTMARPLRNAGGDNFEEACDALVARKRLAGVARTCDPEALERFRAEGHL
jgi:hypothetical protein